MLKQLHKLLSKLSGLPAALVLMLLTVSSSNAFTFKDLENDSHLTPESLIRRFSHFKFKLLADVQKHDAFLASQEGDCDDFATLSADILKAKGFTPHLIAVHMAHQFHVVCYVDEIKGYLDYNNRSKDSPIVPSNGSLEDVANKVARSFRSTWSTAAEFAYRNGVRQTIALDFFQRKDG